MAKGDKINYGAMAAARLAGQSVEGAREQLNVEPEDDYLQAPKRRAEPEEGWTHKGQNKDKRFFAKISNQSKPESREVLNLPSAEQCEVLKNHQNYIWFKEGTKQHFLERTKDSGMSEADRLTIFEQNCEEDLVSDIKLIIEDGGLVDWQEFVGQSPSEAQHEHDRADKTAESKYFDRNEMNPILEKFFRLSATSRERSGIDANMLFYFLEGDEGEVDMEWPVNIGDGRTVTKEEYLTEVKKLEAFINSRDKAGASSKRSGNLDVRESAETKTVELKTEAKDWREVKRKSEVYGVGDFHGNIEALEGNLETLGMIKNYGGLLEWSGGNARVVCQADILADRNINGLEVLSKLANLQEQAREAGGELDVIAGNHDDFMTSFLMKTEAAGNASAFESCRQGGYLGLLELARFGSEDLRKSMGMALAFKGKGQYASWSQRNKQAFEDLNKIKPDHPAWQMLKDEREQILENMRQDPKGRKVLEAMCSMKLVTKKDDTLFIHTNPTEAITKYLQSGKNLESTILWINTYYQSNLRKVLLDGEQPDPQFLALKSLFLDTDNREDFTNYYQYDRNDLEKGKEIVEDLVGKFKSEGVNALIHGHSDEPIRVRAKDFDFPIISVDFSAYKGKGKTGSKSILKIAKNGEIRMGKDMEKIRG